MKVNIPLTIALIFQAAIIIASYLQCIPLPIIIAVAPLVVLAIFGAAFILKITLTKGIYNGKDSSNIKNSK